MSIGTSFHHTTQFNCLYQGTIFHLDNFSCTMIYLQMTSFNHTTQVYSCKQHIWDMPSWGSYKWHFKFFELWYLQVTSFHHKTQFCGYKQQSYLIHGVHTCEVYHACLIWWCFTGGFLSLWYKHQCKYCFTGGLLSLQYTFLHVNTIVIQVDLQVVCGNAYNTR